MNDTWEQIAWDLWELLPDDTKLELQPRLVAMDYSTRDRAVVTTDILNVRSGPSATHRIIGKLSLNEEVRIYAISDDTHYVRISPDNAVSPRWVHGGWLRRLPK